MKAYERSFALINHELAPVREDLAKHVGGICVHAPDYVTMPWLDCFVRNASVADRQTWAWTVRRDLAAVDGISATLVWNSWMREYWDRRLTGIPVPLRGDEGMSHVNWTLHLHDKFEDAVDRAARTEIQDLGHLTIFGELSESEFIRTAPNDVGRLLAMLLEGADVPFFYCERSRGIVDGIAQAGVPSELITKLKAAMTSLGCT
jgi:hypothetical protein